MWHIFCGEIMNFEAQGLIWRTSLNGTGSSMTRGVVSHAGKTTKLITQRGQLKTEIELGIGNWKLEMVVKCSYHEANDCTD